MTSVLGGELLAGRPEQPRSGVVEPHAQGAESHLHGGCPCRRTVSGGHFWHRRRLCRRPPHRDWRRRCGSRGCTWGIYHMDRGEQPLVGVGSRRRRRRSLRCESGAPHGGYWPRLRAPWSSVGAAPAWPAVHTLSAAASLQVILRCEIDAFHGESALLGRGVFRLDHPHWPTSTVTGRPSPRATRCSPRRWLHARSSRLAGDRRRRGHGPGSSTANEIYERRWTTLRAGDDRAAAAAFDRAHFQPRRG